LKYRNTYTVLFVLLGPEETMIESRIPILSVCAVRTGCGKSVITRKIASLLKKRGLKVSVIRHPMAYCSFRPVLRFSKMEDVDEEACTIEEREEFEPLVGMGITVYAGIDYEEVFPIEDDRVKLTSVRLQNMYPSRVIAVGSITGKRYDFSNAGVVLEVDPLDAPEMLSKVHGLNPCCSKREARPYFTVVGG
jgi:hypothetical protein